MLFSVIYDVDIPSDANMDFYTPPRVEELWQQTEDDSSSECNDIWPGCQHRKWAAVLNREQFDEFVEKLSVYADSAETMGSIGAPGLGYGVSPAISFSSGADDAVMSAYVTPIPEVSKKCFDERDWQRVRKAMLSVYG